MLVLRPNSNSASDVFEVDSLPKAAFKSAHHMFEDMSEPLLPKPFASSLYQFDLGIANFNAEAEVLEGIELSQWMG